MPYKHLDGLFTTLREVGYQQCAHPRVTGDKCLDCGAHRQGRYWLGGHLEYHREPIQYEVP